MENYGIMRHGEDHRGTNRLTKEGIIKVKKTAKEIRKYITENGYKKVIIYHSPQMRTIITAFLLKVELCDLINEDLMELTFLDENNSIAMSEKHINEVSQKNKKCFNIFITHQPNIIFFLARKGILEDIPPSFFWSNQKIIKP